MPFSHSAGSTDRSTAQLPAPSSHAPEFRARLPEIRLDKIVKVNEYSLIMRDGSKTKKQIDRTALRLFAKKGIKETTIKDIAKAAKIAEGTMYRHYKSKEQLAETLFIENYMGFGQELHDVQARESTTRTKLLAIIHHFCSAYDRDPTVMNYLFLTRHEYLHKMHPRGQNPYLVFRHVIREGMNKGDIPRQDADVATSMVLGIVLQIVDTRLLGSLIKQRISGLADQLAAACLRVLSA